MSSPPLTEPAAQYQLSRNGEILGTYTLEDLHTLMQQGQVYTDDYLWTEGMADWQMLGELIDSPSPSETPPPLPATPTGAAHPLHRSALAPTTARAMEAPERAYHPSQKRPIPWKKIIVGFCISFWVIVVPLNYILNPPPPPLSITDSTPTPTKRTSTFKINADGKGEPFEENYVTNQMLLGLGTLTPEERARIEKEVQQYHDKHGVPEGFSALGSSSSGSPGFTPSHRNKPGSSRSRGRR